MMTMMMMMMMIIIIIACQFLGDVTFALHGPSIICLSSVTSVHAPYSEG